MSKRLLHKFLLIIFRFLVVSKRILWNTGRFLFFLSKLAWHKAFGPMLFFFYRFYVRLKRLIRLDKIPFADRAYELLAHPRFLFVFAFVFILLLLLPHTRFVSPAQALTPGRESVLFHLVGPGDEYFVEENITEPLASELESWDAGAARPHVDTPGTTVVPETTELGALALGGTAVTKPSILPGAYEAVRTEIISYTVQSNDTMSGIAQTFGISVNTLLWENNLNYYSYIRPGQILRILPLSGVSHTIVKGETLNKIAQKYKVETEKIIEANRLADTTKLAVGERLLIPGGTKGGYVAPGTPGASALFRSIAAPPPSIAAPAGSRYLWPTTARRITQYFGWRHTGLDIGGPVGTPIYASRAGQVTYAQCGWNGGYGCNIRIDHGDGVITLYAHNAVGQHYVKVGDRVQQGQAIAGMGSTGRSTGSHVHFEIRVNGARVNPLQYIR